MPLVPEVRSSAMTGPLADVDRALSMFDALGLGAVSDELTMVVIPGPPWSKSRPRFARNGHAYAKPGDVDAEKRTGSYLRRGVPEPYPGNVALGCVFYRPNRQRIDADNLLKHVCDAANGILWADDSQCTAIMGVVELDLDYPRTVVVVGTHSSTMTRGSDATYPCAVCGKPIEMAGQRGKIRKTCSRECKANVQGQALLVDLPVACAHCGKMFLRVTTSQTMCSVECRAASFRGKRRAAAQPFSRCSSCGAELTHHRGGRCRDCWIANPAGNVR